MTLQDRYNLNRVIPAAALHAHRAWLIAYDEEGVEGQSEATLKPNELGDPSLPGYTTVQFEFADGSQAFGVAGGDFGVASQNDLDNMRLYSAGRVWGFELTPDSCEPSNEDFFTVFAERLPMRVHALPTDAYEGRAVDFTFSVDADGSVTAGAA